MMGIQMRSHSRLVTARERPDQGCSCILTATSLFTSSPDTADGLKLADVKDGDDTSRQASVGGN